MMTESSLASVDFWCVFRKSVYSNLLGTFFFNLERILWSVQPYKLTLQTSVSDFILLFFLSFFIYSIQ